MVALRLRNWSSQIVIERLLNYKIFLLAIYSLKDYKCFVRDFDF
jgi:hypothetical protein